MNKKYVEWKHLGFCFQFKNRLRFALVSFHFLLRMDFISLFNVLLCENYI